MISLKERIVKKLDKLPESHLREVLDFVEFMSWRGTDQDDPLLSVTGSLSGEPLSASEIEEALYSNALEASGIS